VVEHDGPVATARVEVATLVDGALVAAHVEDPLGPSALPAAERADATAGVGTALGEQPQGSGREEADIVRRWMTSEDVRVRHADGMLATQVAGGAVLASVREELRAAGRATRGDEVVLTRAKVRRRGTTPTAAS